MNFKKKGLLKEQSVANYLIQRGWTILSQNKKILGVEVDILAQKNKDKAIIEVKSIKSAEQISSILKDSQKERLKKVTESLLDQEDQKLLLYLATVDEKNRIDFFPIE